MVSHNQMRVLELALEGGMNVADRLRSKMPRIDRTIELMRARRLIICLGPFIYSTMLGMAEYKKTRAFLEMYRGGRAVVRPARTGHPGGLGLRKGDKWSRL